MTTPTTTSDELSALLTRQKEAFKKEGAVSLETRKQRIQQVIDMLVAEQQPLTDAMEKDFGGRNPGYTIMNDILGSLGSLKYARDNLDNWIGHQSRTPFPPYDQLGAGALVRLQPKGSVGIIGTWNAPVFTLLSPLACVLAAGNRAILKPSEITPCTAEALAAAIHRHLDPELVTITTGGPEVGADFAAQPFDHLVFTGSTAVGKKIMAAAARNLTPVTLELGGKSPAIISQSADLKDSCRRLAIAKGTNGGQLCISPDTLYIHENQLEAAITSIKDTFTGLYPTIAGNPDLAPAINDGHLARVERYIDDARKAGTRIESTHGDTSSEDRRRPLRLVINPAGNSLIMQEEIFGSALVIQTYKTIKEVVEKINSGDRPLALYYYGKDLVEQDYVLDHTLSGGVTINDALMHAAVHDAPFGGVGASGMGHYHGYEGFLEFSHMRTVFSTPEYDPRGEWGLLPPYNENFQQMIACQVTSD